MLIKHSRGSLLTAAALLSAGACFAGPTLPTPAGLGLNPGDQYAFVFVTSGTTAATNAAISYYNTFVQTAASAAGIDTYNSAALNWKAVVSTGTSSPLTTSTNAPVGSTVKVFLVNGTAVANGSSVSFYAAGVCDTFTCQDHLAPINITELGTSLSGLTSSQDRVWTGAQNATGGASGSGVIPNGASGPVYGHANGVTGVQGSTTSWMRDSNASNTNAYRLYAVSDVLTVATTATPEPASMALLASGFAGLVWFGRRRRA